MSGFWNTSDGQSMTAQAEYEQEGGNLEPIPNGTTVLAAIDEAKWAFAKDSDARYLSLRWTVLKPEEYGNRKVFQKMWVDDDDPRAKDPAKKRDNAKRMLVAIDTNSGGGLLSKGGVPTDEDLSMNLLNKPMLVSLQVWKMKAEDGSDMSGNWVNKVAAAGAGTVSKPAAKAPAAQSVDLDDIPF